MYKSIYPADIHRLKWIRSKDDVFDYEHKTLQKGLREALLCKKCEGRLNQYETYVAGVLGPVIINRQVTFRQHTGALVIQNLNYQMFKLFELSLLWRSSVSSLIDFEQVNLGKRHEERLRQMLLTGRPGEVDKYGCGIFRLIDKNQVHADGLICSPYRTRAEGIWQYAFVITGLLWLFNVSSHPVPQEWVGSFVQKDGVQVIWKMPFLDVIGPKLMGKKFT